MLQAVIKNKLNRYLRKDGQPPEDLITDCFFGPLRYLDMGDAGKALAYICHNVGKAAFHVLDGSAVSDIELWPRKNSVEPDVLVHCRSSVGTAVQLLIEVKWNSPLGEAQAVRQWCEFNGSSVGDDRLLHLIVCRSRTSVERDIKKQEEEVWKGQDEDLAVWRESRLVLSWYEVAKRLRDRPRWQSAQLQRWAYDTSAVLKRYGERPFEGFANLPSTVLNQSDNKFMFWDHQRAFRWPLTQVDPQRSRVFWQSEN